MKAGISILIDFFGVRALEYHSAITLESLLEQMIEIGGLIRIQVASHQFKTQYNDSKLTGGATAFALLAESHISIHTWPEFNELLIDVFTCGSEERIPAILEFLKGQIPHTEMRVTRLERGELN